MEEVELAEPHDDEVRMKIMTCTICHWDIHGLKGEFGVYEGNRQARDCRHRGQGRVEGDLC